MSDQTYTIRTLDPSEVRSLIPALAAVLVDCVAGGASVSFMAPFTQKEAEAFFTKVAISAERGERIVLAAFDRTGAAVGTVQVILEMPPNQPHRGDVAKLLVHRSARGQGLAALLMTAAEGAALARNKTLLVLDTVTGSVAERLYARLGWVAIGSIPDYAVMPDGALCATTVFYKKLGHNGLSLGGSGGVGGAAH